MHKNLKRIIFCWLFLLITICVHYSRAQHDGHILNHNDGERKQVDHTPLTILISITSPPMIGPFGNVIRSHAIAVEARRRGIRVAWMMGLNYKESILKVLEKLSRKSSLSEEERVFHNHSQDSFYYLETLPVFGSVLPDWLSRKITLNGTRKFDGEVPGFVSKLVGGRTIGNFYQAFMGMGLANGSVLRKLLREHLEVIRLIKPFVIVKEIGVVELVISHLTGIPVMETISTPMRQGKYSTFASSFVNGAVESLLGEFAEGNEKIFPSISFDDILFSNSNLKIAFTIPELETPFVYQKPNVSFIGMASYPAFLQPYKTVDDKLKALERKRKELLLEKYPNQKVMFFYFGKGSIAFEKIEREIPKFCQLVNEKLKPVDGKEYHCYVASDQGISPYTIDKYTHFDSWYDGDEMTMISELTFSHGGANSVMQSIYYGIPQIVSAGFMFERVFNGISTEIGRCGILLKLDEFTHDIIYIKLFSNNSFIFNQLTENTKFIQRKLMERGGANQLFSDVETWLNRSLTPSQEWQDVISQRNEIISRKLLPIVNSILERDEKLEESLVGQFSLFNRDIGMVIPSLIFTMITFPMIISVLAFKLISCICSRKQHTKIQ